MPARDAVGVSYTLPEAACFCALNLSLITVTKEVQLNVTHKNAAVDWLIEQGVSYVAGKRGIDDAFG